jgi:hypothetical protein
MDNKPEKKLPTENDRLKQKTGSYCEAAPISDLWGVFHE